MFLQQLGEAARDTDSWSPTIEVISGYRIVDRHAWYWAALARPGERLVHVADWSVQRRSDPLLVKGDGLWAEHTCDAPMEQWSVTNETYATALDDPDDALGRAYGEPTAVAFDIEWYATAPPEPVPSGYRQTGVVHGVIELAGTPGLHLEEVPRCGGIAGVSTSIRSRCLKRTPTPGRGRRSRSPTARCPIGRLPPMAGAPCGRERHPWRVL